MQEVAKFLVGVAVLYAAYCGVLYFLQRHLVFPSYLVTTDPEASRQFAHVEKLRIPLKNGSVEAWFLPATDNGRETKFPLVIIAHGNGEVIDFLPAEFARFNDLGVSILMVEYPGYGRSGGKPSQQSITNAYMAAFDLFSERPDIDPDRIVLMGRSLGGGVACSLAAVRPTAALILLSTFTSARALSRKYMAPPFLVKDPFDNIAVIRRYQNPLLVIHGLNDEVIPFSHALALTAAAQNAKLIQYNCGHNDCPPDQQVFWKDIEDFLAAAKILPAPARTLN